MEKSYELIFRCARERQKKSQISLNEKKSWRQRSKKEWRVHTFVYCWIKFFFTKSFIFQTFLSFIFIHLSRFAFILYLCAYCVYVTHFDLNTYMQYLSMCFSSHNPKKTKKKRSFNVDFLYVFLLAAMHFFYIFHYKKATFEKIAGNFKNRNANK